MAITVQPGETKTITLRVGNAGNVGLDASLGVYVGGQLAGSRDAQIPVGGAINLPFAVAMPTAAGTYNVTSTLTGRQAGTTGTYQTLENKTIDTVTVAAPAPAPVLAGTVTVSVGWA